MTTRRAGGLLSTIRGWAARRGAGAAGASTAASSGLASAAAGRAAPAILLTRTQLALRLLAVACVVGSGVGVACCAAAKQVPQTPPGAGANREAAAPDLPPEPPKGDAAVPIDPKVLARLAEQLQSKNWDERTAALAALDKLVPEKGAGETDFRPVIEPLFAIAGWGGIGEKESLQAERLLVRIGGQAAPSLRRRLESPDAHDRWVAVELLVRIEPPGAGLTELLRPLVADPDYYVRRVAIEGLATEGPAAKAAISDLEKEKDDPKLANQVRACVALIHIDGPSKDRIDALVGFLNRKEPCDGVNAYAADELGKLGRQAHSAAPQLLAALKHPDAQVRIEAACALGPVGADPDKAVATLIAMLKDEPEREVRRAVAVALGEMGPAAASAVPALREALRGDGGGWWVAAEAIGKIGGPDAVPALVEALGSKDDDIRLTAIRGLGDLGPAAAPAAEALRKEERDDPREWNRKAAAEALKKIASPLSRP